MAPTQSDLNAVLRAFWRGRRPDFIQTDSFDHFIRVRVPVLLSEFVVRFPQDTRLPAEHEVRVVHHWFEGPVVPEWPVDGDPAGPPLHLKEAGWRRLTYCARLYVDVRHVRMGAELVLRRVFVGELPIPSGCCLCTDRDSLTLSGGNYMIDGILDTLVLQHTMARNTVVVEELRRSHQNVLLNGHIRCGSLASRYQSYMFGVNVYTVDTRVHRITVRVPSTHKREVPLVLLLLAFDTDAPAGSVDGSVPYLVHQLLADFACGEIQAVLHVLLQDNPVQGDLAAFGGSAQTAALHILNQPSMRRRAALFANEVSITHDRTVEDVMAHEVRVLRLRLRRLRRAASNGSRAGDAPLGPAVDQRHQPAQTVHDALHAAPRAARALPVRNGDGRRAHVRASGNQRTADRGAVRGRSAPGAIGGGDDHQPRPPVARCELAPGVPK